MTAVIQAGDLITTLRGLAAGASIAAVLLIPPGHGSASLRGATNHEPMEVVTTFPDGGIDPRIVVYRTHHGLEAALPTFPPLSDEEEGDDEASEMVTEEENDLATALRDVSNLPVKTLADLVGVSRMSYHNWLSGHGVSEDHRARLIALCDDFTTLRAILGPDTRAFLEKPGPYGAPLKLLQSGDSAVVIGLALRRPSEDPRPEQVSEAGRLPSGVGSWLRPVPRLAWTSGRLDPARFASGLEELSPRALPEGPVPTINEVDAEEGAHLAYRIIVG